ncbi:multicopper oxidase [Amniculicola lignicola CBS 123094]|uniref:Multicopper oxidase n=1 Tax=Amniculicola lignicola CBS 123094 TaxID=1392246 RepID=A0A6A5WCU5_9PLEO|nr:multicopper oxidase [Amniculicola lignicola CBS 123094]
MLPLLLLAACASLSVAKTVTYNFDIGWVIAAPDGFARPVIGINGQWPIPTIEANVGDEIVVNVQNSLGNETTSLHFHGMYQRGTASADGAVGLGQCPIAPGDSYTYRFIANPAGTHWYHSHDKGQYPDGLRGKMIIHDPAWEASLNVDKQYYLSMGDWYHTQFPYLVHDYLSPNNTNGDFPSPDSFLFNETRTMPKLKFAPGKRYLIRIVNFSAVACNLFHIDGHPLIVVGVDGVEVQPQTTDSVLICAGQRYDFVVEGMKKPQGNYKMVAKMTTDMFTKDIPSDDVLTLTGEIVYDLVSLLGKIVDTVVNALFNWKTWSPPANTILNDMTLRPLDNEKLLTGVNNYIELRTNQTFYPGVGTRIGLGLLPWTEPKLPSLYTALTTGKDANKPATYGVGVDPWVLQSNDVVQVYMENPQIYPHPMHLHGHTFQVVARGTGTWDRNEAALPSVPMKLVIPANGYIVLRFRADNPGVWFFHCHIDFHLVGGMASTFIEAPSQLQASQSVPAQGAAICVKDGQCVKGNCACKQGAISASDSFYQCNTIFNDDGMNFGALVSPPNMMAMMARDVVKGSGQKVRKSEIGKKAREGAGHRRAGLLKK